MDPKINKIFSLIFKVIGHKPKLYYWFFIRFLSALLPLLTIYQFSFVIKLLLAKSEPQQILLQVFYLFIVRILDNYLRIKSVTKLEKIISNISFDLHYYFFKDLQVEDKAERHTVIQAIRNFSDAVALTLNLLKQPGVDSLVQLLFIPTILIVLDFRVFILAMAYILIYFFIDFFTTSHYSRLKDALNTKTENYYAKIQDDNDAELERLAYSRHFRRLTRWGFTEWFALQNTAVIFYSLILLYLVFVNKSVSDIVLIVGYISQVQVFLNSISQIQDSLTDTIVGLKHLAKNSSVSALNLEDLI